MISEMNTLLYYLLQILAYFQKTNYWRDIGNVAGFHQAVGKLRSSWRQLEEGSQGYTNPKSIWGQLAQLTKLKNKHTRQENGCIMPGTKIVNK